MRHNKRMLCLGLAMTMLLSIISVGAAGHTEGENMELFAQSAVAEQTGAPSKRKSTFDYPLYGDPALAEQDMAHNPQKRISDEEFFGLWNEEQQEWMLKPYWNYEGYPALAQVEAAAKRGDYYGAKTALLEYYRGIQSQRVSPTSSISASSVLRAQLLEKNFYAVGTMNGLPAGIFTVSDEWQDVTIDVTDIISSSIGLTYRCFEINTIDKEDSYVEFMTREGEAPPTLTLTVNGVRRVLTAAKDGYIVGGEGANETHGGDTTMIAHESGYYMQHDENTKRPYFAFDLTSLKSSDVISNATLTLRGRSVGAVEELNPAGEKELLLYQWNDAGWEEKSLCWNSFSEQLTFSCNDMDSWDYVTSSSTTVKGKICFFHRGNELSVPASVYSYTKDERYAYTFLRQEMAIVNNVGCDPNIMNSLDMSGHISRTIRPVFLVLQSEYMTPEIFTALIKHLWQLAHWQVDSFFGTMTNNWASYATQAVFDVVTFFKELSCAEEWIERARVENTRIIGTEFVLPDGSCVELSQGYTKTLLATLQGPFATARRTNSPLPYTDELLELMRKCLYGLAYGMAPGFHGFHWGDSQDYDADNVVSEISGWWPVVFPEETDLEFFATRGASGAAPEFTSVVFPDGLRAVLRNGWDERALALQISAKQEGSHGHKDANSLSMWAYGRFLISDPGYGTTLTGDIFNYMRSSQQHNLVTMNEKNAGVAVDGVEVAKEINDSVDYVSYSTPIVPDASEYRRSVLFPKSEKFWIVSDYLVPNDASAENTYQQYWHMLPESNISIESGTKIARSNFDGANVMVVPVGAENIQAELEDAIFSPGEGAFEDCKKAAYHKSGIGNMTYDTLLIPLDIGKKMEVETEVLNMGMTQESASSFMFRLTDPDTGVCNTYTYYHLNDATWQGTVQVGRYTTDATVLLVKEDSAGKMKSVFVKDASYVKDQNVTAEGNYLFKTRGGEKAAALSIEANGQLLQLESSDLGNAALEDITIYGYGSYQGAVYDGEKLNTSTQGGYLYFESKPVLNIEASNNPGANVNGGTSGGSGSHAGAGRTLGGNSSISTPADTEPQDTPSSESLPLQVQEELKNYWGKTEIETLYRNGIVAGDSGLRLEENITRAEFAALLCRAKALPLGNYANEFSDVTAEDWHAPYIQTAWEQGWIQGNDGQFRPDDFITREEMCKLLVEANGGIPEGIQLELDYEDKAEISAWAEDYVCAARKFGLMNGYEDGCFKPAVVALRGEAFVTVYRFQAAI